MTLEAIKEAITELPVAEKTCLAAWFLRQDREEWDRQIEEDFSAAGRGVALLEEAEADVREGRVRPMDEILAEARATRSAGRNLNRERLSIRRYFGFLEAIRRAPRRRAGTARGGCCRASSAG